MKRPADPIAAEMARELRELGRGYAITIARFWSTVLKVGTHWRWAGALDNEGVPIFKLHGGKLTARRVAVMLAHHSLTPRQQARSSCGDLLCMRPAHVYSAPASLGMNRRAPEALQDWPHALRKQRDVGESR